MKTAAAPPAKEPATKAKEPPKPRPAPGGPAPAAAGNQATPSVTQPAGNRFRAPQAPSATPGMPSTSRRQDKTP